MPPGGHWSLAIHGGAGVIPKGSLTPDQERAYRNGLNAALAAGSAVLAKGGSSLDAVEAAVRVLEDDPHFNAGRGAVFDAEGKNQLDAAIMDGATLRAGAVAGVSATKNPIVLARAVMEHSRHVLLTGAGADQFAREQGVEQVDPPISAPRSAGANIRRGSATRSMPPSIRRIVSARSARWRATSAGTWPPRPRRAG